MFCAPLHTYTIESRNTRKALKAIIVDYICYWATTMLFLQSLLLFKKSQMKTQKTCLFYNLMGKLGNQLAPTHFCMIPNHNYTIKNGQWAIRAKPIYHPTCTDYFIVFFLSLQFWLNYFRGVDHLANVEYTTQQMWRMTCKSGNWCT